MKPILEINNISKKFRISHENQPYLSLRDRIGNIFKETTSTEYFWALKDVNFNVMPGDTIGIIGKNGAGKSTLLKILSRITPPTSGKITCRGRIASLLEVGTGFHPELNGRENVFLNGSILGMKRSEIQKQFDAIVDFAGVEKFIDTPLKHYSSGMQLRLAFAVAAFLEPEILIIDEVLAVGDAEFQKKCMGKMDEVSKSGRTILFVSHNLASVSLLCKRGILVHNGEIQKNAPVQETVEAYLRASKSTTLLGEIHRDLSKLSHKELVISKITFSDINDKIKIDFFHSEDVFITFNFYGKNISGYTLLVSILNTYKTPVFSTETKITTDHITLKINKNFLAEGSYSIRSRIHIINVKTEDYIDDDYPFNIIDTSSDFIVYNNVNYFYGSVIGNCDWIE
ncbi:MAG: ABC transporter ATP-binding protein [Bacteroidia bacterium]